MDIESAPESAVWTAGLSLERREAIRELHRLRPAWNLVPLLFASLWIGAGWVVLHVPAWPVRIGGILLMGAVVHAMAILMHEGVHGNLFRNETLDRWVGFLLGAPALFSCMAYRVNHMLHHAFNRTEKDPDEFTNLSRDRTVLSIAFYAWLLVGMPIYLIHVPMNALRRGSRRQRAGVLLEYSLLAALYGAVFFTAWRMESLRELLLCWVYPMVVASVFGAIRGWAEHMMTRPGHPLTQTRTVTSNALVSFFMCNLNYHLEHHLYPAMPWYNLPKLHRLLRDDYARAGSAIHRSYAVFLWNAIRAGVHGQVPRSGSSSTARRMGILVLGVISVASMSGCLSMYHAVATRPEAHEIETGRSVLEEGEEAPTDRHRITMAPVKGGLQVRVSQEVLKDVLVEISVDRYEGMKCRAAGPDRIIAGYFGPPPKGRNSFLVPFLFAMDLGLLVPALFDCLFFSTSDHTTRFECAYESYSVRPGRRQEWVRQSRWVPVSAPVRLRIEGIAELDLETGEDGDRFVALDSRWLGLAQEGRRAHFHARLARPGTQGESSLSLGHGELLDLAK